MLKVLIVCAGGIGTSVVLKDRLEKTIPDNEYSTSSIADFINVYQNFDVILTFKELEGHVELALKNATAPYKVKTVEGFNAFAKDKFNEYLRS